MKKISIEVPEALDRQVRVLAAQLDLNRSKLARLALQEKVERLTTEARAQSTGHMTYARQEEASQNTPSTSALTPSTTA